MCVIVVFGEGDTPQEGLFRELSTPDDAEKFYPAFAVSDKWALEASLSFSIVSWRTCSLSCPISSACSLMVSSNSLRNGLSFCAFCTGIGLGVALPLVKTVVMVCSPSSGSPSFGATIVRSLRILIKSPTGWFSVPKRIHSADMFAFAQTFLRTS